MPYSFFEQLAYIKMRCKIEPVTDCSYTTFINCDIPYSFFEQMADINLHYNYSYYSCINCDTCTLYYQLALKLKLYLQKKQKLTEFVIRRIISFNNQLISTHITRFEVLVVFLTPNIFINCDMPFCLFEQLAGISLC